MNIARAYDAFCKKPFPLPHEKDVIDLESRISVTFPPDYRQFLLEYNGGCFNEPEIIPPEPEMTPPAEKAPVDLFASLYGIRATHPVNELGQPASIELFDDNDPPEIVPIGYTIIGYLILLVTYPDDDDYGDILLRSFTESFWLAEGIADFFELLQAPRAVGPAVPDAD